MPGYARNALVDNRPGAAGRIAIDALKAAPPDGRTLLLTPASTVTIYSAVYKKLSYNPMTDLLPVSLVCTFVHGFAVGPLVPAEVKTLAQYAAWAKANPAKSSLRQSGRGLVPALPARCCSRAASTRRSSRFPIAAARRRWPTWRRASSRR